MKNQEGASTSADNYDTMKAEIEKAVETMQADESTPPAEEPKNDAPAAAPAEETPPKDDAPAPKADAPEAFEIGDAEIERAVKAGMSIADARSFKDKSAFERVCSLLEGKGAPADGDASKASKDSGDKPKDGDGDSADFDVPDITEDEEFDPKLVKLGSVVRKMGDALKSLREENKAYHLAEGLVLLAQGFQREENKALREMVGKSGEDQAERERKEAEKAAALEKRKSLRLAPPGGEPGKRKEKTEDDVMAEVASEIASKFGI